VELALNLLWGLISALTLCLWVRHASVQRKERCVTISGAGLLVCVAFLLFPVLSTSDDLHATEFTKAAAFSAMCCAIIQSKESKAVEDRRTTTVLVADASRMDCQLLAGAIQRASHVRVIGCATSSREVLSSVQTSRPDVAVISARLEDGVLAGFKLLRELRRLRAGSRIVLVLDADERDLVVAAFRSGARGIFCRTGSSKELCKCIEKVHDGQIWANSAQMEYIVDALMQAPAPRAMHTKGTVVLSKREEQVCGLAAAGLSNREISKKLGLSEHTVKNYLFRIFEKLGISTRIELVLYTLSQEKRPESAGEEESPAPSYKFGT
jgi:DNA-binding NarL/FixJ family response regulator